MARAKRTSKRTAKTGRRSILTRLALAAEGRIDAVKRRIDERGDDRPIEIATYRGYGTPGELYLKGRVLAAASIPAARPSDSAWRNLANMYRRFESDEIPGARVLARYGDAAVEALADEEGFFEVTLAPDVSPPTDTLWHPVDLTLVEPRRAGQAAPQALGAVLIPAAGARFGVISDVDDTVLRTDATSLLRMLRATFLSNAHTRLPFPGVAAFYRALQRGAADNGTLDSNPLFYVSSSPWNLYDMLEDFFAIRGIPAGPLVLRDWGLPSRESSPLRHHQHKIETIRRILDTYPALPFLLIGDSGQADPEIYRELVELYPRRIQAIYIRNVSRRAERLAAIQALAEQVAAAGSVLILADDTLAAARDAAERGWITPAALAEIAADRAADRPAAHAAPTITIAGEPPVSAGVAEALLSNRTEDARPPTVIVAGNQHD